MTQASLTWAGAGPRVGRMPFFCSICTTERCYVPLLNHLMYFTLFGHERIFNRLCTSHPKYIHAFSRYAAYALLMYHLMYQYDLQMFSAGTKSFTCTVDSNILIIKKLTKSKTKNTHRTFAPVRRAGRRAGMRAGRRAGRQAGRRAGGRRAGGQARRFFCVGGVSFGCGG